VNLAKKQIPLAIALFVGLFMWLQYYVPYHKVQEVYRILVNWDLVIYGFAMIVGIYSLLYHHATKLRRKEPQWGFSVIVYISMAVMVIAGFVHPMHIKNGGPFQWLFMNVQVPMQSTMFSILAFYIVSAAYRAFRARTREATILLITGIIVMLGRVPIGEKMLGVWLPHFTEWILNTPSMAAQRGIMLGVGLAIIATSLRIIFGIERTYMGGGAD
jgi:hypothetical protein